MLKRLWTGSSCWKIKRMMLKGRPVGLQCCKKMRGCPASAFVAFGAPTVLADDPHSHSLPGHLLLPSRLCTSPGSFPGQVAGAARAICSPVKELG